jgi:hypothetical protein
MEKLAITPLADSTISANINGQMFFKNSTEGFMRIKFLIKPKQRRVGDWKT